jgi:hypothetical protein
MQAVLTRTPLMPAFVQTKRMLYYEPNLSLTVPNTGLVTSYFFSANGLYDPNITGTGHQPIGFDQMMSLYEQYTVTRSSVTVTFRPLGTCSFGVSLAPDTTIITNSPELVENGLCKYATRTSYTTEMGLALPRITLNCDIRGYFGQKTTRELLNNTNLYGTAAANPTEQAYFAISGWESTGLSGGSITLGFEVVIAYDAIFWEPRKIGTSFGKELPPLAPDLPPGVKFIPPDRKIPQQEQDFRRALNSARLSTELIYKHFCKKVKSTSTPLDEKWIHIDALRECLDQLNLWESELEDATSDIYIVPTVLVNPEARKANETSMEFFLQQEEEHK